MAGSMTLRAAGAALILFAAVACDASKAPGGPLAVTLAKKAPKDTVYLFKAKKDGTGTTVRVLGRHFVAPFRVECVMGAGDAAKPDFSPGYVGLSVISADFISPGFYSIQVTYTGGGLDVRVTGAADLGSLEFPGVHEVEVAFDHDGDNVTVLARASAADEYQQVAQAAAVTQGPLVVSLDANSLPKKARVAWDDLRIPLATKADGVSDLVHSTHLAIDRLLDALALADDGGPDIPGAREALVAARGHIDNAAGVAKASFSKRLAQAAKKIDKAIAAIDKAKSSKAITKKVIKAGKAAFKAAELAP